MAENIDIVLAREGKLRSFTKGFSSCMSGARRICECGKEFYNPGGDWDWYDGELEALLKSDATATEYSVGTVIIDGKEFVMDCECWKEKAGKIINWIDQNAECIAQYLDAEKARKEAAAESAPTVG